VQEQAMDESAEWARAALERFEAPLLRFAGSIVGPALAQDAVQDTFLRLCAEDRQKVEGHLAAWLFTVCRNRAIELRRAERRVQSLEPDAAEANPDSGPMRKFEQKESLTRARAALDALPQRQRHALLLKIDGGLSYKEIAAVLNVSVTNVGVILHTALAKVRAALAEEEPRLRVELGRSG
jgi:RNA polymerase sigma factor (sigma-70 family)